MLFRSIDKKSKKVYVDFQGDFSWDSSPNKNPFKTLKTVSNIIVEALNKLKKDGKTEKQIKEEITRKISEQTKIFMLKNEIPGLCEDGGDNPVISLDPHIKDLIYKLAETSSNFCEKNNLDKDHMILFIQLFFNMMKISNEDVLDFKEKFGLLDDSSDDDEYDDDDDEL